MVGAVIPTGAYTPKVRRKGNDGKEEKGPGDFEPEDAADAAEGLKESAYAASYSGAGTRGATA